MKKVFLLTILMSLSSYVLFAQGSTKSIISGLIEDEKGEILIGASVLAVHERTGSQYGAVTNEKGYYVIPNLRVGGPYRITVSFIGYNSIEQKDVYTILGKVSNINFSLIEQSISLEEIDITASSGVFDPSRNGAESNISNDMVINSPTIQRDITDYTRLTPSARVLSGDANAIAFSVGGINSKYNAIFIDGAVNNDVFGLADSGTNGGQAGISPVSIDAIEQISINIAPYDVKYGGFAGASINAVTRSGTNDMEGSAYYLVRNHTLSGKTPTNDENITPSKLQPFSSQIFGGRLGGAIIKDKLFFFANVEIERRKTPFPFSIDTYEGTSTEEDINSLIDYVENNYDYDPGGYTNNVSTTDGEKLLIKLDWNISKSSKLTFRHSYVSGRTIVQKMPSSRNIYFFNTGYELPSVTNSSAFEWNFNGTNFSNGFVLGYTRVRDNREILGIPFPQIVIQDGSGVITIGTDNFSYSNILDQDIITLTNNFTWYKGIHSFTFGTHNEFFRIQNLFAPFSTPLYQYGSLDGFLNAEPAFFLYGHELPLPGDNIRLGDTGDNLGPAFTALQAAFYVQDEIQFLPNFNLSIGLRVDIPVFLEDSPLDNTEFNTTTIGLLEEHYDLQGARAGKGPATQFLIAPRIGFNWDIIGEKKYQLRGGVGIFTSRVPWVWPGGSYIRNGLNSGFSLGVKPFYSTPNEWASNLANTTRPSGDVDIFAENFKYPQVLKASLGVDIRLPYDFILSLEETYTKTINNIFVESVNINPEPVGNLQGADNRPLYDQNDNIDPTYGSITLVKNTSEGFTNNVSAQLQKTFKNFTGSVAYSFTRAESVFDGINFINSNHWQTLHTVNGRNNKPGLQRSRFDAGSRITAFASYRKEYLDNLATSISIFFEGRDGDPYSYVYGDLGALTNENNTYNTNLIYVPREASEITFGETGENGQNIPLSDDDQRTMWNSLDNFISSDSYLNTRRGEYAERNVARSPFEGIIDLKLAQDFYITTSGGKKKTSITIYF